MSESSLFRYFIVPACSYSLGLNTQQRKSLIYNQSMSPRILFFNVNGSGMGHMTRCLAYARRMRGRAGISFFSLASAIEIMEGMGFEAEYFVSHYWSRNTSYQWNCELAIRFGMMLERVRPDVVVFDGTWPFQGFMTACNAYGRPALVWSNRGLFKDGTQSVKVDQEAFDLVIRPGELGAAECGATGSKKLLAVPPVALFDNHELYDRATARSELGLEPDDRFVLFSLGPGNLKDVTGVGHRLAAKFRSAGYEVVWARAPISVRDVPLPDGARSVSVYPLVRYMRAFDVFVGAAGYNSCCEVVQAQVPSLLVPNMQLVDDQLRRALLVAQHAPAVVSACEAESELDDAFRQVLNMAEGDREPSGSMALNGAEVAAEAILALALERATG